VIENEKIEQWLAFSDWKIFSDQIIILISPLFYKQKQACNDCNKFVTVHFLTVCTENRGASPAEKIENRRKQAFIISNKKYNLFRLYRLHKNVAKKDLTTFILCRYNIAIDAHPNSLPQRRKVSLRLFHIQSVEEEERRQCSWNFIFRRKNSSRSRWRWLFF
jgi:hypothetical protein